MFRMVYDLVWADIASGAGMSGILFWRWKGEDPTIRLGAPGEEATLGAQQLPVFICAADSLMHGVICPSSCLCCITVSCVSSQQPCHVWIAAGLADLP
jgi:hypothetical protein